MHSANRYWRTARNTGLTRSRDHRVARRPAQKRRASISLASRSRTISPVVSVSLLTPTRPRLKILARRSGSAALKAFISIVVYIVRYIGFKRSYGNLRRVPGNVLALPFGVRGRFGSSAIGTILPQL